MLRSFACAVFLVAFTHFGGALQAQTPTQPPTQPDAAANELPAQEEQVAPLNITPIAEIPLSLAPINNHKAPKEKSTGLDSRTFGDLRELRMEQGWTPSMMNWRATNFAHRPLYFEDILLERHGQRRRHGTQPLWSAAHFFTTFPILPYKIGIERPCECIYTLGYGRPGNCKPSLRRRFVYETDAALFESGAWVAAVLLLP